MAFQALLVGVVSSVSVVARLVVGVVSAGSLMDSAVVSLVFGASSMASGATPSACKMRCSSFLL